MIEQDRINLAAEILKDYDFDIKKGDEFIVFYAMMKKNMETDIALAKEVKNAVSLIEKSQKAVRLSNNWQAFWFVMGTLGMVFSIAFLVIYYKFIWTSQHF